MTGMRRGELLGLRWLDVDLAQGCILLPQTKNAEGRIVYLNEGAQAVLASISRTPEAKITDRIFGDFTPDQVSVNFRRACARLKVADFRFHDLRHTAASWLRMSGADIHTVAQLLGHKDLRMARPWLWTGVAHAQNALQGDSALSLMIERRELSRWRPLTCSHLWTHHGLLTWVQ
jgi:integrase